MDFCLYVSKDDWHCSNIMDLVVASFRVVGNLAYPLVAADLDSRPSKAIVVAYCIEVDPSCLGVDAIVASSLVVGIHHPSSMIVRILVVCIVVVPITHNQVGTYPSEVFPCQVAGSPFEVVHMLDSAFLPSLVATSLASSKCGGML